MCEAEPNALGTVGEYKDINPQGRGRDGGQGDRNSMIQELNLHKSKI